MRAGDTLLLRSVFRGRIRWATPHRLVEQTDGRVAMFLRVGTRGIRPSNYRAKPYAEALLEDWECIEQPWHTHHVLRLTPFAAAHSVDLYWTEDWRFVCWYVNLQQPLRRTPLGFDTFDQQLDVVVAPDRRWEWKDVEEFDDLVVAGILSGTEHAAIRGEAERVVAQIEAWEPPFSEGWEDWRPPPEWTLPELATDWRAV
jgi:predicted RNA-binding protein associated with RNAse of E/G family